MKRYTIIQAATIIESMLGVEIMGIEFEDGSGRSFNATISLSATTSRVYVKMGDYSIAGGCAIIEELMNPLKRAEFAMQNLAQLPPSMGVVDIKEYRARQEVNYLCNELLGEYDHRSLHGSDYLTLGGLAFRRNEVSQGLVIVNRQTSSMSYPTVAELMNLYYHLRQVV